MMEVNIMNPEQTATHANLLERKMNILMFFFLFQYFITMESLVE